MNTWTQPIMASICPPWAEASAGSPSQSSHDVLGVFWSSDHSVSSSMSAMRFARL